MVEKQDSDIDSEFNRRSFLKLVRGVPLAALGLWLEYSNGIRGAQIWLEGKSESLPWLLQTPGAKFESARPYPDVGWLETGHRQRPGFIDYENGHRRFLHEMVMRDKVLGHAARQSLSALFSPDAPESPGMGDFFADRLEMASQALKVEKGEENPWSPAVLHVAIYTLAATLSPYFSRQDMEKLGVANLPAESDRDFWWFKKNHMKIPHLYSVDIDNCEQSEADRVYRCIGGDRAMHFAQHLFLSYIYRFALSKKLQDAGRVPRLAKISLDVLDLFVGNDRDLRTIILDLAGQLRWEKKEAEDVGKGEYVLAEDGTPVVNGFDDPLVWHDIAANSMGLWFALRLAKVQERGIVEEGLIDQSIEDMNRTEELTGQASVGFRRKPFKAHSSASSSSCPSVPIKEERRVCSRANIE